MRGFIVTIDKTYIMIGLGFVLAFLCFLSFTFGGVYYCSRNGGDLVNGECSQLTKLGYCETILNQKFIINQSYSEFSNIKLND
jgi:hypothetical protein